MILGLTRDRRFVHQPATPVPPTKEPAPFTADRPLPVANPNALAPQPPLAKDTAEVFQEATIEAIAKMGATIVNAGRTNMESDNGLSRNSGSGDASGSKTVDVGVVEEVHRKRVDSVSEREKIMWHTVSQLSLF
ncbi:hypothetical protein LR48_Vigan05g062700 [Vigna angularis]|uniref:Uncharacterized protein n=1 Tax=Phaseolus angularis TaxID=3914 RepID=A0A0L9UJU6_PHAAN|nr:hypothetical protein LR48_Vigan05g062700 [Vigna angularis]